jgi:hypothetical protein
MDRPYFKNSVGELEQFLRRHAGDRPVLAQLKNELTFRKTDRAKQLLREVEGLLDGDVPMPPKPGKAARPEDQYRLIDDDKVSSPSA